MRDQQVWMPSPQASFTTCRRFDLSRALIRGIQVLQDGGKWVVHNERLPTKLQPLVLTNLPKENFETNVANFESNFDESDRDIIEKNNQNMAAAQLAGGDYSGN